MGGGCEIALACHLIVADTTATFALSEVRGRRAGPAASGDSQQTGQRDDPQRTTAHRRRSPPPWPGQPRVRRRHRPRWSARPGRGNPRRLTDLRQSIPAGHGRDRWHPRHGRCHPAPIARTRTHCWSARTWSKASPRSLRKATPLDTKLSTKGSDPAAAGSPGLLNPLQRLIHLPGRRGWREGVCRVDRARPKEVGDQSEPCGGGGVAGCADHAGVGHQD
jgi:hypothetical protein